MAFVTNACQHKIFLRGCRRSFAAHRLTAAARDYYAGRYAVPAAETSVPSRCQYCTPPSGMVHDCTGGGDICPAKRRSWRAQRLAPASSTGQSTWKNFKKHRLSLLHGQEIALHAFGKTSGPFPRLPTAKPSESRSSCIRCGPLNFPYFFIDICAD